WALILIACGGAMEATSTAPMPGTTATDLAARAYVVGRDSEELTVFDLRSQALIGRVATGGLTNHMAELSADLGKIYVTSSDTNELVIVDARTLTVSKRVPMGRHPTHLALAPTGDLAVMIEDDNAVAMVDTKSDELRATIPGFFSPHFIRFSRDGRTGYVANIGAHHLTKVDLRTLRVTGHIALEGFRGPPNETPARDEGGFADAQVDHSGRLFAAHRATGRVLIYDTLADRSVGELQVGIGPWIAFAQHPFPNLPLRHLVPSFDDRAVALIDADQNAVTAMLPGDAEAYGVNFSSRTPDRAFVMNRIRRDIAVVDTANGAVMKRIDVGGNTETAATSADGSLIVAAVSSANRVVFIDPSTGAIAKTFEGAGRYPWSVTIPNGQNYCH
ncbi:MAG TPA: hypothetical protein VGF45_17735, partial [Polyangia bacterium]